MIDKLYSHHISYGDPKFDYKDKTRWADVSSIYGISQFFVFGGIYELDVLLSSNYIAPSYKKRIPNLKEGANLYVGSDGGGRMRYLRRLTKEDIELIYNYKNLKSAYDTLKEELERLNPDLIKNIKNAESALNKHKKILSKNKIIN